MHSVAPRPHDPVDAHERLERGPLLPRFDPAILVDESLGGVTVGTDRGPIRLLAHDTARVEPGRGAGSQSGEEIVDARRPVG
ncbi:MAG: hypothetical protein ABIS31_07810, partial [Candidatus Eisenbacteria bacterium]